MRRDLTSRRRDLEVVKYSYAKKAFSTDVRISFDAIVRRRQTRFAPVIGDE